MPVGQSVMCRLSWLQRTRCETITFLEIVQLCKKRCENVSADIKSQVQDVAISLKKGRFLCLAFHELRSPRHFCCIGVVSCIQYFCIKRFSENQKCSLRECKVHKYDHAESFVFVSVSRTCTVVFGGSICMAQQIIEEAESQRVSHLQKQTAHFHPYMDNF